MKLRLFFTCIFGLLIFGTINTSFAESDWRIYKLQINDDDTFKIPYKSTAHLNNINFDNAAHGLLITVASGSDDVLEISIPRNLIDSQLHRGDDSFLVYVDGKNLDFKEINSNSCFRTLQIPLTNEVKELEIVMGYSLGATKFMTPIPPIQLFSNTTSINQTLTIEGCTSLSLNENNIQINIIDPYGKIFKTINVIPNIDGTFSTSLASDELKTIEGYTVTATYANYTAVPEFPIVILILATSIMTIMLFKTSTIKHMS